ncbi:glycoside hydrolase family 9 protein [Candidatus Sumerlaeota bacterium]|nr:glycoside hydrolase family 9 protein [Candidatus Sumerlaeota bacterium]
MSLVTRIKLLMILIYFISVSKSFAESPEAESRLPLKEEFVNSLRYVWLNKKVRKSRVIHDMETLSHWSATGIGRVEITKDRFVDGSSSLRFTTLLRDEERLKERPGARLMGESAAALDFSLPQDWSDFNRIAVWIYVHPSDVAAHPLYLKFTRLDAPSSITDPHYATVIQGLTAGQWNYVLWEIPNLKRDKVTEFRIAKLLTGHDAKENGQVTYDIDRLELQQVDAEKYEGWEVAPGKIAYNHVGYKPNHSKRAIAGDLAAPLFQVREAHSGRVVLTKPVESVKNDRAEFQILDFSEVHEPGTYFIWAGDVTTRPFRISDTLWLEPIRKALNFYYSQRCGFDVPGVHPACHKDVQGIHDGVKKVINGGWHDAGDLSQGSFRTGMSVYSMLQLKRRLDDGSLDSALSERVLEEALWGLDWILKTRFKDGYRITWNGMGMYTDNAIGTLDDVVREAQNNPWENFIASGTEALAFLQLKGIKPDLSMQCLEAAREDWEAAVKMQPQWLDKGEVVLTGDGVIDNKIPFSHRWFSGGTYLTLSWGIISSIHLHEATGQEKYIEKAVEYGRALLKCQQREFFDGVSLTGFFYTSPEKFAIVNHRHAGFEESPLLALKALCGAFPDHEDWIEWYAAATLHSEYFLKRGAHYSAPYNILPNALFRKSDILDVPDENLREAMLRQFNEGTHLTDEYHLRMFPIWTTRTHHGNTAVHLSQTLALVAASRIRNDFSLENLAAMQMQWAFGGNPFSQSLMYGEGYDYPPLYAYNPGDIVGSLPVGVDCVRNDEPFWSASNHSTFKEIWIVPVNRFLWNALYLTMPAIVQGELANAESGSIVFSNKKTSEHIKIDADASGKFEAFAAAGEYEIKFGSASRNLTILSGMRYHLALNPEKNIHFIASVKSANAEKNLVQIRVIAEGRGRHDLSLRIFNGKTLDPERELNLKAEEKTEIVWDVSITNPKIPWVAVVIPDNDPVWKQDLIP